MKTLQRILFSLIFISFSLATFAQVSYGFKIGVNYNDVSVPSLKSTLNLNPKVVQGIDIAAFAEIEITDKFSIRPELAYVKKGFRINEGLAFDISNFPLPVGVKATTNIRYIQIPVLGKYSFGEGSARPYIMAGPAIGYAVDANLKTSVTAIIDFNVSNSKIDLSKKTYQRAEVSAIAGAGIELDMGNGSLFFEARYQHSFTDMLHDPIVDLKMRNKGFALSAGFKF